MLDNNEISFILTKNLQSQNQTEHIDIIHYHIYRLVKEKKLAINSIESIIMLADSFIKIFSIATFKKY